MTPFEEKIKKFPYVHKTYELAMEAAQGEEWNAEDLDYFLSKNCRAWFFEKHLKVEREASDQEVRDINKAAIVPFELSDIQLVELDQFEKRMAVGRKFSRRVMKCRRARISTIWLAVCYHIVRFNQNKKGLVFADKLETSRKLRRILDMFYQSDDLQNKPEIGRKTLCEGLYLHPSEYLKTDSSHDSFILLGSGEQDNSSIGGSLDFMHWSEAALTKDAATHWTTISPSMQGALFNVAESTPSMSGQDEIIFPDFEKPSEYCDLRFISWLEVAEYRVDDKALIENFAPYVEHNLYGKEAEVMEEHKVSIPQMLWRRLKLDELKNLNSFRQVFPISKEEAFYASAGLFFHKSLIEMTKPSKEIECRMCSFSDQGSDNISLMNDPAGAWKVYENYSVENNYLIAVDTAEGKCSDKDGRDPDYSVAIVFKLDPCVKEVAFLRERMPPEILGEQVAVAAKYYGNALVVPERNNSGLAMIVRLMQIHSNIYVNQRMKQGSFIQTMDYGFVTTSASKVYALSCLLQQIRDKERGLVLRSDIIRMEMSKFCQIGVRYSALSGYHDDTIAALWLMAACIFQTPNILTPKNVMAEMSGQLGKPMGFSFKPIPRDTWNYEKKS